MPNKNKFLVYNIFFQYSTLIYNIIIGLFLFPYFIYITGLSNYGIWISALSFISILLFFDPGFTFLLPQNIASLISKNDTKELNLFIFESIVVGLITWFILIFILFAMSYTIFIFKPENVILLFIKNNYIFVLIYIFSQIFFIFFNSLSLGFQIVKYTGTVTIFTNLTSIFLNFIFLKLGFGISSFIMSLTLKNIIFIIFHFFYFRNSIHFFDLRILKFILYKKNIKNQNLATFGAELPKNLPNIIIGSYAPNIVASIKILQSVPELARGLIERPFYIAISPLTEILTTQSLIEEKKRIILHGLFILFLSFFYFFFLFNFNIITLWIGNEQPILFDLNGYIVLYISAALISKVLTYIMYAKGNFNRVNKFVYITGFISVLFSITNFWDWTIKYYFLLLFTMELIVILKIFKDLIKFDNFLNQDMPILIKSFFILFFSISIYFIFTELTKCLLFKCFLFFITIVLLILNSLKILHKLQ